MAQTLINQDQYPLEFALHKKHAQTETFLDLVWTHSHIVMEIALSLYDSGLFDVSQMDRVHVIKAGLLFEIGVYDCGGFEWIPGQFPSDKPYIQHCNVGAEILKAEAYAQEIVNVAQTHEGVGLTDQDIQQFGLQLPPGNYMPSCPLEWLICYAAKYHSKAPKFKNNTEIEAALEKFGADKLNRFRQLQTSFGIPNMEAFIQKYDEWHKSFAFTLKQIQEGSIQNSVITIPTVDLNSAGIAVPSSGQKADTGVITQPPSDGSSFNLAAPAPMTLPGPPTPK
jgi:hypothetical protein